MTFGCDVTENIICDVSTGRLFHDRWGEGGNSVCSDLLFSFFFLSLFFPPLMLAVISTVNVVFAKQNFGNNLFLLCSLNCGPHYHVTTIGYSH